MSLVKKSKVLQNTQMREVLRISQTRLKNLYLLWHRSALESGHDIKQKDFAASLGLSPNQFNQYLTHRRNVGDRVAQRIETKLSLGLGWMDQQHQEDWELNSRLYDGRIRQHALSGIGSSIAARIEALGDENATKHFIQMLELYEERQSRANAANLARSVKPQ